MNRRRFLSYAAAAAFPAPQKSARDRVRLGPMQVEVSRLAMGTGTNGIGGSSNQTRKLGLGGLADLLKAGYDQGVTFWDSADQYGTHFHLRQALKSVPREKVTILTKTRASTQNEMRADLDRFRRELGTEYLDILLIHAVDRGDWPERYQGAMAVMAEARERGILKTHGISCHTQGGLKTAARTPWVQVALARINFAGVSMDADPQTALSVLRELKAAGKGVIGMKILGVGRLRSRVDEALQFVLAQDCVDCFTIGSESRADLAGLLQRMSG